MYAGHMTPTELLAKEAHPGTRETVAVSRGIEITLVYGDHGKVTRVEFPGVGRTEPASLWTKFC
jgi:hypothetical protein